MTNESYINSINKELNKFKISQDVINIIKSLLTCKNGHYNIKICNQSNIHNCKGFICIENANISNFYKLTCSEGCNGIEQCIWCFNYVLYKNLRPTCKKRYTNNNNNNICILCIQKFSYLVCSCFICKN